MFAGSVSKTVRINVAEALCMTTVNHTMFILSIADSFDTHLSGV
jgi:hypothetical protein